MRKISTLLLALAFANNICCFAQDTRENENTIVKDDWNFGGIPAISYDADRGFMYGAIINIFNYGDGKRFPQYDHSLYLELVKYTGGTTNMEFQYDSDRLFPNLYTSANVCYKIEEMYQFYGFNGYKSIFNQGWIDKDANNYISRAFYNYNRKQFRLRLNIQGNIHGENLRWMAGVGFQTFNINSVDLEKYNRKKDEEDKLPNVDGLFEKYQKAGIISEDDANGGNIPSLSAGIIYDSRDFRTIPQQGIWASANIEAVPNILGADNGFARIGISYSQYLKLVDRHRLTFAYRISWQGTLWQEAPFYYMTQFVTPDSKGATVEGTGGSVSLRGILRNRIIGNDIAYGNFEMRSRLFNFQMANQNFFVGSNIFSDLGKTTRSIKITDNQQYEIKDYYYKHNIEKWHISYGAGLKIGMNDNFVVSLDYGKSTNKQDGNSGFYMEIDYLF